jgi:hypothetical protein
MAHSDWPGCTVTVTVGVTERSAAESEAFAGELKKPARGKQQRHQQDQGDADQDDLPAPGQAQRRQGGRTLRPPAGRLRHELMHRKKLRT